MARLPLCALFFSYLVVFSQPAWSQPPAQPSPEELAFFRFIASGPRDFDICQYLAHEAQRLSQRALDGAKTAREWEVRRSKLHQEYLDMLGLWPLPEKTPLHATVTGRLERQNLVVEKLHFQSRPGLYVTGNLYRPKEIPGKLPAILYVCGHSGRGRDGNKTAFQEHGMWFATNGYICLIIDTLQLGEIPGVHHGTYNQGRWWWQALGYTPAGVECWNGIRALDYLVSRPDVDLERLAVTGISGGGATTFWIAAADERVRCAVPVSGTSDLESYVGNKIINGHCDCMFLVNTYRWEWTTIAALVAPRPLLFCNSDNDPIFPMDANRRIIARLRTLYKMYGRPELVDDYVSHGGHDYRPDLRIAIFKWINKHIKNETGPVTDAVFTPFANKDLRVFPEERDVPADAINARIDEVFVSRAQARLPNQGKYQAWKNETWAEIRKRVFHEFPDRIPASPARGLTLDLGSGDTILAAQFDSTADLDPIIGATLYSIRGVGKTELKAERPTLVVLNEDDNVENVSQWAKPFLGNGPIAALGPRGVGVSAWTRLSPPNYVERAHALLGRTVDAGRVWDIAATVRALNTTYKGQQGLKIVGRGQAGVLAAYAALFEPTIAEVVAVDPPPSHRQGPIFLNILRILDIPEALGLLAPRRLSLVNARDKAFERTAEIYKIAGAESKFERK
jgi:cephalosporin-C deacetylase-like acetyl esterase